MDSTLEFVIDALKTKISSVMFENERLREDLENLEASHQEVLSRLRNGEKHFAKLNDDFSRVDTDRSLFRRRILNTFRILENHGCDVSKIDGTGFQEESLSIFVEQIIDRNTEIQGDIENIFREILETNLEGLNHFLISPSPAIRKYVETIYRVRDELESEQAEEAS